MMIGQRRLTGALNWDNQAFSVCPADLVKIAFLTLHHIIKPLQLLNLTKSMQTTNGP